MRVIISGGGTGGHVFPAIAIADEIKRQMPDAEILFVGANGKIEMEKVPKAGYQIKGLTIQGIQRKLTVKNLLLPYKILGSMMSAVKIVRSFKPDCAIGVGGYASGPVLKASEWLGIPTFLQEQNSYAGVTNKLLAKKAKKIYVAYKGMDKFFDKEKIVLTGNPVRATFTKGVLSQSAAKAKLGIAEHMKVVLISGGSLGARTLNDAMLSGYEVIARREDVHIIWQCGKLYMEEFSSTELAGYDHVEVTDFIDDMASTYAAADMVVCRAGALTISEICVLGKASILVPSPNVAEDHQTHNAMALVKENAALLVKDKDARADLVTKMYELLDQEDQRVQLSTNVRKLGFDKAAETIVSDLRKVLAL